MTARHRRHAGTLGPVLLATSGLLGACAVDPYACTDDAQCVVDGRAGRCEAIGYCSYPDEGCEAGSRFSTHAGDGRGGACVGADDPVTGDGDGGGEVGGPGCGNGEVEGDEACDDGNAVSGDGCSPQCLASGTPRWAWRSSDAGPDARAVDVEIGPEGGIYAVGDGTGDAGRIAAFVVALTPDGTQTWAPVTLGDPSRSRRVAGVAAATRLWVAGEDTGQTLGTRAWVAELDRDGTPVADMTDDTSGDERWRGADPGSAGGAVLLGELSGRGTFRWTDADPVQWQLDPGVSWLAAAGRGDGAIGLATTDAWQVRSRGGPLISTAPLDGQARAITFAADGGLVVAGQRGGAAWLQRWSPDGTAGASWTDPTAGDVLAVARVDDDVVVASTQALHRIDAAGSPRWTAPLAATLVPSALCVSDAAGIVLAGTVASPDGGTEAFVGAFVP